MKKTLSRVDKGENVPFIMWFGVGIHLSLASLARVPCHPSTQALQREDAASEDRTLSSLSQVTQTDPGPGSRTPIPAMFPFCNCFVLAIYLF